MIKKKICMLGAFSVGKTSLVQKFVRSIFSEKYLTTVGVKVDKKEVQIGDQPVDLLIWDIHGEDITQDISPSYLRGSSGYILVVDGTRRETLDAATSIASRVRSALGPLPAIMLLNKSDLEGQWEIDDQTIESLTRDGWLTLKTSAKTGMGVEAAFQRLARDLIAV
ncbi:MAG: GTP-binding protein [Lentisphaerae bacterium]|nr:GTP-binding protein [Lentisphaerota bacterium]